MKNSVIVGLLFGVFLVGCKTPSVAHKAKPVRPKKSLRSISQIRKKQIFLVIDDAGLTMRQAEQFVNIPISMTIAIMPHRRVCREVDQLVRKDPLKEVILHQPMEANRSSANPGRGAIYDRMGNKEVLLILEDNLLTVPSAVGINNHMGSRVTENGQIMKEVLSFCQSRKLFFLDSKTSYNSVVPKVAKELKVHLEQRHVFLDIVHERSAIERAWRQTIKKAEKNGYVVVIGHAWSKDTADVIRESYQVLQKKGYTFHQLSELYK
jgi:polysaccharide deacetylase 2 family uncharacterized protein YibQ